MATKFETESAITRFAYVHRESKRRHYTFVHIFAKY